MPTLHVHTDESGTLDFGPKGSAHYVFTAVWTHEPSAVAQRLQALRYDLLRDGVDLECFHASEDSPRTRTQVFDAILGSDTWQFAAVVVKKDTVYKPLRVKQKFYPKFLGSILRFVLRGNISPDTDRILIYTDRVPVQKNRRSVEKAIQQACAAEIDSDQTPFHMYHHLSASNAWLQVCDYCSWSVYRKHERGDTSYYNQIRSRLVAPELVLFD